jgi:hypothetical protein
MKYARERTRRGDCTPRPRLPLGRREPYTERGILRVRCVRCGAQAERQWQCCANGNRWVPICWGCDVELNAYVLQFMRVDRNERAELMARYVREHAET